MTLRATSCQFVPSQASVNVSSAVVVKLPASFRLPPSVTVSAPEKISTTGVPLWPVAVMLVMPVVPLIVTTRWPSGMAMVAALAMVTAAGGGMSPCTPSGPALWSCTAVTTLPAVVIWYTRAYVPRSFQFVVLVLADRIQRVLGTRVVMAFERLMGLILVAIAVEMLLRGLRAFVAQLPHAA